MKSTILITCLLILFVGCESNPDINSDLMGTWIEQADRMDTIDFTIFGSDLALNLRRGSELRNGYILPRYGAGYYAYELIGSDTIGLCSLLSGSCISGLTDSYTRYYFKKVNSNTFQIMNFYNPNKNSEEVFTFSRRNK